MAEQTQSTEKRRAPRTGTAINALIAACNKNDRFKLLEDESILPANLDNPIHPVFNFLNADGPMNQMLMLASQFLAYDSLLAFFIPLLYGHELTDTMNDSTRTYLSDPVAQVSETGKAAYLKGVREALRHLGHGIEFRYTDPGTRVYARTMLSKSRPFRASACTTSFQDKHSCLIEVANHFGAYYTSESGYATASRSAQFRHDFLFATTLVHEIVHAFGVLKRGNLTEPHIRADYPETEWGSAWEHFMFGYIINPQDRRRPGTHLLMRKVWADPKLAAEAGGKEYTDVPMRYIAQWFRKESWDMVARNGPTGIPPPTTHFKIQSSNALGAWVVSSDCKDILPDLQALHRKWRMLPPRDTALPTRSTSGETKSNAIRWRLLTKEQLRRDNVKAPVRIPKKTRICISRGQAMRGADQQTRISPRSIITTIGTTDSFAVSRASSPTSSKMCHKRPAAAEEESGGVRKRVKR